MNLSSVIARLKDSSVGFKLVGGAAKFEQSANGLTALPAAFVLPSKDAAEPSPYADGIVQQVVRSEFSVLIAVRNLSDDEGAAALGSLEDARVAVRTALLAWPPDSDSFGCEYVGGQIVVFENGVLWWEDNYTTATVIRSA